MVQFPTDFFPVRVVANEQEDYLLLFSYYVITRPYSSACNLFRPWHVIITGSLFKTITVTANADSQPLPSGTFSFQVWGTVLCLLSLPRSVLQVVSLVHSKNVIDSTLHWVTAKCVSQERINHDERKTCANNHRFGRPLPCYHIFVTTSALKIFHFRNVSRHVSKAIDGLDWSVALCSIGPFIN